jgi:hypothetical protein
MLAGLQGLIDEPIRILAIVLTIIGAFLIVTIFNKLVAGIEKKGDLEKGKLVHLKRFFQIVI